MPRLSKIGAAALAAFGWTGLNTVTASYLVVAGGGGAGCHGGGGAGGYLTGTTSLNPTQSYTVTVGAGGAGVVSGPSGGGANGSNGSNSQFGTLTASVGGGAGGGYITNKAGSTGGSGGGGGYSDPIGSALGGAGTSGQGNAGGSGFIGGAGGGGASAAGSNGGGSGSAGVGGAGGNGTASSISGSSVTYAGGGGGGNGDARTGGSGGAGGTGGGGAGSTGTLTTGAAGTANLGGGGGGGGSGSGTNYGGGGQGGSGVVIISYVGAQQFGGGVVTSSGGNTIHTFTTSGTLSPLSSLTASSLVVAGGGGGGKRIAGGGGAGGYRTGSGITLDTNSTYLVTVGAGGAGGDVYTVAGTSGSNSVFNAITSAGGGGGAGSGIKNGVNGGSGGGSSDSGTAGSGNTPSTSPSQGSNGGVGSGSAPSYGGGGGGGASAVGGNGSSTVAGNGGAGTANSISGASVTYAGGGGGGSNGGTAGTGGSGGGGNGTSSNATPTGASANLGGGGGGCGGLDTGTGTTFGGQGGSGVVIISYPGSTQQMAGGTVTVAGGNVIHTFTSSGYLAPIYSANNSLRFRRSASGYLTRTPPVASNRKTYTWSAWVKLGSLDVARQIFGSGSGATQDALVFEAGNTLFAFSANASQTSLRTTQVFRDPSAWYHVVWATDTTQATASDRSKLYINGVQVTAFSTATYPSQNYEGSINNNGIHYISSYDGVNWLYDGYMDEINFIDGQALTPNSFGTSNGLGVWQPIRYGGSYGTNGFYLPFNSGTSTFVGSYNGTTAWFNAANNAAFAFGTGSLTIEAWVYPTQNSYGAIFDTRSTGSGGPGVSIYANSGNGIILVNNTTYNPSTYLSLNQWSHIAAVRNGASSWTVYINGNSVLTFTDSSNLTDNACFSGKNYAGTFFFSGAISNLRVVKGTAVYTSNFTLPTSPLTNISGTSLLTLQNSTLIDNSTNAFSLTNTGPITLGTSYPFSAAKIFNDQSPQGNNWTPNNISGASGSTLDYMTDVPTLTSATAANYATFNPLAKGSVVTISDGNLKYSSNGASGTNGLVSMYISTGMKTYFEITCGAAALYRNVAIGGMTYTGDSGVVSGGTGGTGTFATWTTGNVIRFACDFDAGTIACYKDATLITTVTGVTNTSPWAINPGQAVGLGEFTANFGQQPFAYSIPSGFSGLNTFNLTTPTIGATAATTANKYFDVTLYTGTGATQTITNSGSMQPDFIWFKSRALTYSHALFDSVRGVTKGLDSDTTATEVTSSAGNDLSAFTSTGFTVGPIQNWNSPNNSSSNPVAWQWRASNTTAVTNTAGSITSTVSANTTAGFSILTYTGNNTSGATVGHGLGVKPSFIVVKKRTGTDGWGIYHTSLGATKTMELNTTAGEATSAIPWNNTEPDSSVIYLNGNNYANSSSFTYVMYCFAQIAGYSAFSSYTGNGSTDGAFIYTGFRPKFVIIKSTGVEDWRMFDTSRSTYNIQGATLYPNDSAAENAAQLIDINSNGFKCRTTDVAVNGSGTSYIYMAFAESPFKYANAR